jgi:hypothetical protein
MLAPATKAGTTRYQLTPQSDISATTEPTGAPASRLADWRHVSGSDSCWKSPAMPVNELTLAGTTVDLTGFSPAVTPEAVGSRRPSLCEPARHPARAERPAMTMQLCNGCAPRLPLATAPTLSPLYVSARYIPAYQIPSGDPWTSEA